MQHYQIRDIKLIQDSAEQSVAVEFGDGKVRVFSARELYEASGFMGKSSTGSQTASQRRAEQILAARRGRR